MLTNTRIRVTMNRVVPIFGRVGRGTLRAVVLALALIGFLQLTRGTAVRHVQGVAADGAAIGVAEQEFPLMATMATGAWLAPGNRVEVMQNGDGTFPRLWQDLRSAQRSITLQLYYGAPGRLADTLSEILRERATAGVRVFVLYESSIESWATRWTACFSTISGMRKRSPSSRFGRAHGCNGLRSAAPTG